MTAVARLRSFSRLLPVVLGILVCALTAVAPALAQTGSSGLVIDITHGTMKPMPIAIPDFFGKTQQETQYGRNIAGVVSNDLESSGLFQPIDHRAFIQTLASLQTGVAFPDWRQISAQALVQGDVALQPDGRLKVEFRLWDVFGQTQMVGEAYTAAPQGWRRIAHIIADAIYKRMTGEEGYFDTQIVYVSQSGPKNHLRKRLAIIDQDGENNRFLTSGADLVLTPRFSPTAREIVYMSYYHDAPRVYILQIDTGRREMLGDFPGMTFAPRFSPDGNKVIFSMSLNGASDIYTMNLLTHRKTEITHTPFIDTSPCYSPDGKQIVFNSDRGGSQQLYVMNADGSDIHRISFGEGRYATPVWSPRGDLIAFTKMLGGQFYIGVMHPDGSGERELAKGWLVEGPTWAPNGRVLAFFRETPSNSRGQGYSSKIYTIDLTGNNERELITPQNASDPAWSPLLP
jgi:TolB protein